MTSTTATATDELRELDHRRNDGIDVHLLWDPRDDLVLVVVFDAKTGDAFTVDVPRTTRAYDVFHHPYAYAARGTENENRRVERAEHVPPTRARTM